MEWKPMEIDDVTAAFPAQVKHLMPPMEEIPREFKDGHGKWNELFSAWFCTGLKSLKMQPKEGINEAQAMRHIRTIMGSYEPQHEHKEAACAYLLSLWFDDAKWEARPRAI